MERHLMQRERLDAPGATRSEIEEHLRTIAMANRWLGGTSAVVQHLSRMIGERPSRQPVRILDLATGGADIPIAIAEWARRQGIAVQITAIDNSPAVVEAARRNAGSHPEIRIENRDIRLLPYRHRSFEYVTCSQIIHHLQTEEVTGVLRAACMIATQGVIVSDLHRRPFCRALGLIGVHLTSNRLSRMEALSFENAFAPEELDDLAAMAGLPRWTVYRHGPCRLALVADLGSAQCQEQPTAACHAPAPC